MLALLATSASAAGPETIPPSVASQRLEAEAGNTCLAVSPGAANDTRLEGSAALYVLETGGDPNTALALLRRQYAAQNMDASSPLLGQVVSPDTPTDFNDTVFAAQAWAPILLRYHSGFSASDLGELRTHASAALAYLQKHPVGVDYTNIHLLISEEELVFGEIFGDPTAVRRGTAGMTQWLDAVGRNGVHEFESPTYVTVDMDALYEGATYTSEPYQRGLFVRALNFLWSETLANLFLPTMRIAGAESRSYDALRGADEPLDIKLNYAGFDAPIRDRAQLRCFDLLSLLQESSPYSIPPQIRELASDTPRVVEERWAPDEGATKYTYVTSAYAIGSSNEDYDPTDRVAAIDLAGEDPALPPIRLIGDKTGYWYGPTPRTQHDGGHTWYHAPTRPSIVQAGNLMLILTDLDGGVPDEGAPLSVDIVLPALSHGIAIGNEPVKADEPFDRPVGSQHAVTVHIGNTTAAARIAFAENTPDAPESIRLEATAASVAKGAARVIARQATSTPVAARDLRGIILLAADSGPGAATIGSRLESAKISQSRNGSLWTVTAEVGGHVLSASYDLATHKSVQRTVDGSVVTVEHPLSVNGRIIAP